MTEQGSDGIHSKLTVRSQKLYAHMFEETMNAASAITPEGSVLAPIQAANVLPAGARAHPTPVSVFLQAKAEHSLQEAEQETCGQLAESSAPIQATTIVDEPDWGLP